MKIPDVASLIRATLASPRHCEERGAEAIHTSRDAMDCFAALAMTTS
jgi:hypothetical protein